MQQIFVTSPVGMAVVDTATCRIVVANPALGQMLGYTTQALTQLTLHDLILLPDADLPPTDSLTGEGSLKLENNPALPDPCAMGLGISLERSCRSKLGHGVWVNLSLTPLQTPPFSVAATLVAHGGAIDLTLATLENITQRKQTEIALAAREDRYRTLFINLPGAVYLKLEVVAEGVGTQAHVDYLQQLRCQYGQGYWFAKPLPAEEARFWLHQSCLLETFPVTQP